MKLNCEQITSAVWGAIDVNEEADGFHFFRFSHAEQEAYRETKFENKMQGSAGVEMVFDTDATAVRLTGYTVSSCSRQYYAFDVFANDCYMGSVKNFEDSNAQNGYSGGKYPLGEFDGRVSLGAGNKRVRVVFPWSTETVLREIEAENATVLSPVEAPSKKLVLYGDSITHGFDALHPSGSYAARLTRALGCEGFNKAIGGACWHPPLGEADCGVEADIVTVAYGTNDWNSLKREDFYINCKGFMEGLCLRMSGAKIFVITPIWRKDWDEPKRAFGDFYDVEPLMREICADLPVTVISGDALFPHDTDYFGDRKLHPNLRGFEIYFENLLKQMQKFL